MGESLMNVAICIAVVFVILIIITQSLSVAFYIVICVSLVDLFLCCVMTLWNVSYNVLTGINVIIAIGLAVDYSAHIGHAYLHMPDKHWHDDGKRVTKFERRVLKAKGALKSMGSSVFHGAFSTFLAVLALAGS